METNDSETTLKECNKCLLEISNQNHCCSCWQQWNNEEYHCDKCHKTLPSQFHHCDNCCLLINNPHYDHCCKCKKYHKKTLVHCIKCHFDFDENDKHCCKCHASYTKNEYHCCKCQITCDINKFHCCGCNTVYDEINNHCCSCKIIFTYNNLHCCKCKTEYDKSTNHCSICHLNYKINEDHCCECSFVFNKGDYHCKLCHYSSVPNNDMHCCKCIINKKICDGSCETNDLKLLFKKLHDFIIENSINCDWSPDVFYNDDYVDNYEFDPEHFLVSHCFKTKCDAYVKFIKTIKQYGYKNLSELLNDDLNYKFVLHGTNIISAAQNICCNGFDNTLRGKNGQAHGAGEYFSDKYHTGEKYSKTNGCIVVTLILNNKKFVKCINKREENWYIVNNISTKSYTLPIGIMSINTPIDNYIDCPKNILNKLAMSDEITAKYYLNDGYQNYDEEINKIILENIKQKKYVFEIKRSDRKFKYKIDLLSMTQTNTSTDTMRGLIITCKK